MLSQLALNGPGLSWSRLIRHRLSWHRLFYPRLIEPRLIEPGLIELRPIEPRLTWSRFSGPRFQKSLTSILHSFGALFLIPLLSTESKIKSIWRIGQIYY